MTRALSAAALALAFVAFLTAGWWFVREWAWRRW